MLHIQTLSTLDYYNMRYTFVFYILCLLPLFSCQSASDTGSLSGNAESVPVQTVQNSQQSKNPYYSRTDTTKLHVSDAEWKKVLPANLYQVARQQGTERAFTGKLWDFTGKGTYYCAACGNALFQSDAKFATDCGWPSFFETMRKTAVVYKDDYSHGMERIEVLCGRCDAHLGHLFDDGPPPTGKRYCMNSVSLDFVPSNGLMVN